MNENEKYEFLFYHVFLPNKLPNNCDRYDSNHEGLFLNLVIQALKNNLNDNLFNSTEFKEVLRIFDTWNELQFSEIFDSKILFQKINALGENQSLPLYLRSQNATILIKRLSDDQKHHAIFSSFMVNPKNESIMKVNGSLITEYPSSSCCIPNKDMLNSETFANILVDLNNNRIEECMSHSRKAGVQIEENRDVEDPKFVFEWLSALVANNSSNSNFPNKIVKKIRNEISYNKGNMPFRRSGKWISIKVVLNLIMINLFGKYDGLVLYKILMIEIIETLCSEAFKIIESDFVLQMSKKLARRLYKLDLLTKELIINETILDLAETITRKASHTLRKIRQYLDFQEEEAVFKFNHDAELNLDLYHFIANDFVFKKRDHFYKETMRLNSIQLSKNANSYFALEKIERNLSKTTFPNTNYLDLYDKSSNKSVIQLYDIEYWVLYSLDKNLKSNHEFSMKLFSLFKKYLDAAVIFYSKDELGYSRLLLTSIKIVCALDTIATNEFPMLKEHCLGVDSKPLENLLLTNYSEMECAFKLKDYIDTRNKNGLGPSINDPNNITSCNSFSVKHCLKDARMQQVKNEIIKIVEIETQKKIDQVNLEKVTYSNLIDRWSKTTCSCVITKKNRKKRLCEKCLLKKKADNMKTEIYESPFPNNTTEQDLIAFELNIPLVIGLLRDAIYLFKKRVMEFENKGDDNRGNWIENNTLMKYSNRKQLKVEFNVTLGSTVKSFSQTHYRTLHVTSETKNFIKPNGYNIKLGDAKGKTILYRSPNFKRSCTLRAEKPYDILQWTVKTTEHYENQVLSRQSTCPKEMDLKEFIRFGFFRAGHRLQLKNLLTSLEERVLSFNKLGVYSLIAQSLWELGPIDKLQSSRRHLSKKYPDSHADFNNRTYVENLVLVLSDFAGLIEKKWNDHLILLNLIIILNRAISLVSDNELINRMVDCLRKCRQIGFEWQNEIERLIETSRYGLKEGEVENLKTKLLEICCFTILTYNAEKENAHLVMRSNEDVFVWLSSMSKITNFNSLFGAVSSENQFLTNLIRRTEICMIHIEDEYTKVVEINKKKPLIHYIKSIWAESTKGEFGEWKVHDKHWYGVKFVLSEKEVDLYLGINGDFLVDGLPVGRLPKEILNDQLYVSYFDNFNFKVHPSTLGKGVFATNEQQTSSSEKSRFTFARVEQDLLIYENVNDGHNEEILLLIPQSAFEHDFPHYFVNEFSHWLNKTKMIIEFKPSKYSANTHQKCFYFDLSSLKLVDKTEERCLIDINSATFKEIHEKITCRLELEKYVHIFLDTKQKISIELKRLGLNFEANWRTNQVLSKEYSGMIVSNNQELNTLTGLNKGLILSKVNSSKYNKKNQFIVPHGEIEYNERLNRMEIDLKEVSEPAFFSYEIDYRLRRLKAGESLSAWLYLACLHGYTARILPDPFTGLTGTEMALDILQSGYCWSCKPLNEVEESILKMISKISPHRDFYPKGKQSMQSVDWPIGIPSLAAHEAFGFIAEKIVQDSKRISFAYDEEAKMYEPAPKDTFLQSRAYNRFKNNYTVACLLDSNFESCVQVDRNEEFKYFFDFKSDKIKNIRIISTDNYLDYLNKSDFNLNLVEFICKGNLTTNNPMGYSISDLIHVSMDFKNNWINLYNFSKKTRNKNEKDQLKFILTMLCYKGVSIKDLLIFRLISDNSHLFHDLSPPIYSEYQDLNNFQYDKSQIDNILNQRFIMFENFAKEKNWEITKDNYCSYTTEFNNFKKAQIEEREKFYSLFADSLNVSSNKYFDDKYFNSYGEEVKSCFINWRKNRELRVFIQKIQEKYDGILSTKQFSNQNVLKLTYFDHINSIEKENTTIKYDLTTAEKDIFTEAESIYSSGDLQKDDLCKLNQSISDLIKSGTKQKKKDFPFKDNKRECKVTEKYFDDLKESWAAYHEIKRVNNALDYPLLIEILKSAEIKLQQVIAEYWNKIKQTFGPKDTISFALNQSDLWPRIVPIKLLKYLIIKKEEQIQFDKEYRYLIGANGVLWVLHQRINRCIALAEQGDSMQNALKKELSNVPHDNWSPLERPEWLLFEIDSDCSIRSIQTKVADKMIHPPNNQNTVTQLNMGEGKTSVIIPLLVASLANGDNLVRIIVLNSLLKVNYSGLVQKLGGLLNKRVYIFPCNRDISFTTKMIKQYQSLYEECKSKKGVVLTLPEYCLSFKLKGLEMCQFENKIHEANSLLATQMWLDKNSRDILDESDELLSVMYQLIYTSGNVSIVSGGELRWKLAQDVIFRAKYHFKKLYEEYRENLIEYIPNEKYAQAYPTFRLLQVGPYFELCKRISKDILKSKGEYIKLLRFTKIEIETLLRYVLSQSVDDDARKLVEKLTQDQPSLKNICLILRGYCVYDILYFVFSKRYRVDYGINSKTSRLFQAVPYRAKDVPAERAQFSHPDIAILLTVLSYYYEGLDLFKFNSLFEKLEKNEQKNNIYSDWINLLPPGFNIDPSIKEYSSLNFSDSNQLNNLLYPLFKLHPPAINYWLSTFLFPKEAKEFTELLGTSSWDLCETKPRPTTGFSGTNDSSLLLPLTMNYCDIPELKYTNGSLVSHLLKKENNNYFPLPPMQNSRIILKRITSMSIKLLLDVGALTIGSSNKDIAVAWLEIDKNAEAAIYFDNENNLVVINRQKKVSMFEVSPFKSDLGRCVIYLDEYHTRGTDLKIPRGTVGAVTLGKNVTKDKLMQACMRMRMLGDGHTVYFFASNEIHTIITNDNPELEEKIGSLEVIEWAIKNSRDQIVNGFLYWGIQGLSYFKRQLAFTEYQSHASKIHFYSAFKNIKSIELSKFYDNDRIEIPIIDIIRDNINIQRTNLISSQSNSDVFKENTDKMINMFKTFVEKEKKHIHLFDEEFEIELEVEQEEEFEVQRPNYVDFHVPSIHRDVFDFVINGNLRIYSENFIHLPLSLKDSSLKKYLKENAWSSKLFVTKDFLTTVKYHLSDDFLRPPKWIATSSNNITVVLSAYETNELVKYFDKRNVKLSYMMPRNRKDQKRLFESDKSEIVISPLHMEQLAVYSGSLYLNDEHEQSTFLSFSGYCPSPRTKHEEKHFDRGHITRTGYVYKEYRAKLGLNDCGFVNDPMPMVKRLAEIRNYGIVPNSAYHLVISNTGEKPLKKVECEKKTSKLSISKNEN